MNTLEFIHNFQLNDAPDYVIERCKLSLLDLIGVASAGTKTKLSSIICNHAAEEFTGKLPMLFSHQSSNAQGVALAAGMTIDSVDGHDGFNPAKGHIGCHLFPAVFSMSLGQSMSGEEFLSALLMGYEFGARAAMAQHGTVPDYHTSGSWGSVTAAAACARLMKLTKEETRHALGIAEYHGPRSQMMRCIDYPTMLKDGSGWGAMTGILSAKLAKKGFTGAPAITVEEADTYWSSLGKEWYMNEQYYKPYPVCRWAQAPVEGALKILQTNSFRISNITKIEVKTFHEAVRLAVNCPKTTEQAQYSTSFPVAVALARGDITPDDISGEALKDHDIIRLSKCLVMQESQMANASFPLKRLAKVAITLNNGMVYKSDWTEPRWDPTNPPSALDIEKKFYALATPVIGKTRADNIKNAIENLETGASSRLISYL